MYFGAGEEGTLVALKNVVYFGTIENVLWHQENVLWHW